MRSLYSFAILLSLPLLLAYLSLRSRKAPAYRQRIAERFGRVQKWQKGAGRKRIWLHTVSVGEFLAAKGLCRELVASGYQLFITSTTTTGSNQVDIFIEEMAQKGFAKQIQHSYFPLDIAFLVRPFLNKVDPDLVLFMETEIWPNILATLKKRKIPAALINARLSEKSFRGYRRVRWIARPAMESLAFIAVAELADLKRFSALGVDRKSLHHTGNIKSTIKLTAEQKQQAKLLRTKCGYYRPFCVIAASTHDNEEAQVLKAYSQAKLHQALLILAPRHPERFEPIYSLCKEAGLTPLRFTELDRLEARHNVIVLDQLGVLLMLYGTADIAFIGGSLVPVGGHNFLEAAAWGIPLLSGPYLHNFASIVSVLEECGALNIVRSPNELAARLSHYYSSPEDRFRAGDASLNYLYSQPDSLKLTKRLIESTLITVGKHQQHPTSP